MSLRNLPLYIVTFTATCLMLMRKTFSYYSFAGLYAIEILMFLAVLVYACIVLSKNIALADCANQMYRFGLPALLVFSGYSIIRAMIAPSIDLQNLIPGIYPAYIFIIVLFALAATDIARQNVLIYFVLLFALSPFVPYLSALILTPLIGPIESPGWTYVYAVAAGIGFFCFKQTWLRLGLFFLALIGALLAFERGTFVNIAMVFCVVWWVRYRNFRLTKKRHKVLSALLLVSVLGIIAFPYIFRVFFGGRGGRFDVTLENLLGFFTSIFSSDVSVSGSAANAGLAGTRNHRLVLWAEALERVFSNPLHVAFGVGYHDNVAQSVTFRAVHNGYITVFYRNGLVGLGVLGYAFLKMLNGFRLKFQSYSDRLVVKAGLLGVIALAGVLGDALTGTIIDSPFTSFIGYAAIAVSIAILIKAEPENLTHENIVCS